MMRRLLYIIIYILSLIPGKAQQADRHKLSPWLRTVASQTVHRGRKVPGIDGSKRERTPIVTAFVKTEPHGEDALADNHCRSLARFGDIHIAAIPVDRLVPLASDRRVRLVESSPVNSLATDSMAIHLNAVDAYAGTNLPQAFTGRGVVMGIMDVGFDLTHPNFYSRDTAEYRIRAFWDQLSQDTVGSTLPVGRDFTSRETILALAHSRDGKTLTHGTHTLGIAAGSGYDSNYRGMAPESDICLVANAVTDDLPYIDSADVYKYTYATDALGFKYIFDYAESQGKPCVISFSEGSPQDFYGYDQLYYAILDSLTGPGRIIVAAAGNEGHRTSWIHKPRGQRSAGTFLSHSAKSMTATLASPDDFRIRLVAYHGDTDTLFINTQQALEQPDSMLQLTLDNYEIVVEAYPSCYDSSVTCYDLNISSASNIGSKAKLSMEVIGLDADVEVWRQSGRFITDSTNALLSDGEPTHNIHSPSSAPCVICVGANSYREYIVNLRGDTMSYWPGAGGVIVQPSSRGPTMDGRIKPDCVAPGNNIISSYSSYYLEQNPGASDIQWDVAHFDFNGRTYAWNSNSGTSMACPAVGGAIALWLQACPTLSPGDIRMVLSRTANHYDPSLNYPNNTYGYGEINVYAGLLHILGLDAIHDVPRVHSRATVSLSAGHVAITLPEPSARTLNVRVIDMAGHTHSTFTMDEGQAHAEHSLPQLPSGVYAFCIGEESTLIRVKN